MCDTLSIILTQQFDITEVVVTALEERADGELPFCGRCYGRGSIGACLKRKKEEVEHIQKIRDVEIVAITHSGTKI